MNKLFILLGIAIFNFSCTDDDPSTPHICLGDLILNPAPIWVANEGAFNQGNASLSLYNPSNQDQYEGIFECSNNRGLGDILQSVIFHEEEAYLIVNNSQRIEVIDATNYNLIQTITEGLHSPRYGVAINNRLFVSDISTPYLFAISLSNRQVIDSIYTGHRLEQLLLHDNHIIGSSFIAADHIYIIDPVQMKLADSIQVGSNPNAMVTDIENKVWVMCDGTYGVPNSEGLYRVDVGLRTVIQSFEFTAFSPVYPTRLAVNSATKDQIFINGSGGIYRIGLHDVSLPSQPIIPLNGTSYGLGVGSNGDLYVGDAAGFQGPGHVKRFSEEGVEIDSFSVGWFPGQIYFR